MLKKCFATMLGFAAICTAADAQDTFGVRLELSVPVMCKLTYRPAVSTDGGGRVELGELREYCNAPQGYQVILNYTPGALKGAVLLAGEERIVLDGSGQAVLATMHGPRNRSRTLAAIPSGRGFDADSLDFQIVAR